jgi:hypothetical protein
MANRSTLLWIAEDTPAAREALATLAARVRREAGEADRFPLLRWRASGWVVVD